METVLQDIRVTLRNFRRSPGFPLTAIATLALGIGATTAIFTTLSAVLLKPLPYPEPEGLYSLRTALTDGRVTTGLLSGGEIYRLNDPNLSIERAAGFQPGDLTLLVDETPSHVKVYAVSEGFFELFGLPMTVGGFTRDDHVPFQPPPNAPPQQGPLPSVVISTRLWKQLYNGDRAVVGKPIHFAEFSSTVSGVAPEGFDIPHAADIWLAQRTPPTDVNHGQEGFMRLRRGTTIERATAEMETVMRGLAADFPAANRNRIYVVRPLVDSIVGDLGPILIIVMSATGLLLLLSCVNVANLLLARGAARAREMAVRAALGAGWGRLVRQLLTESVLLATAGTIVGVAVGALGLRILLAIGASKLPRLDAVQFLDARILLFSLGMLVITGLVIGLGPAVRLLRSDMKTLMNDSSRSASAGRGTARWLMAMTVAEVALAVMLVAGAGWLVRGFANLRNTDAGFVTDNRLLFDVSFLGPRYQTPDAVRQAHIDLLAAVRNVRGVADVGLVSSYPMRGTLEGSLLAAFHGEPFDAANPPGARQRFASPSLFSAMGTAIIKGRDFTAGDLPNTMPVAIVNRIFVDRYLKERDPIGVQFSAGYPVPDPANEVTIVGVIDDVRQKSLADPAEPAFYLPMTQFPLRRATAVVSVSQGDAGLVEQAIRGEVRKLNPSMAIDFELASEVVGSTIRRQQLGMTLMLIFGGIAIALAAVGIYGVVSYANSLRRDEMATRLALGASPRSVFQLVMKQGAMLGLVGAGIGVALAYFSGQLISNRVYAIRAADPLILAVAALLITAITFLATTIPAARAARLDPARALQSQ
jgi:predicted permease